MGLSMRRYMGREEPAENEIWTAVETAIDSGVSAARFLEVVREAWDAVLAEKAKRDDATWVAAKKGATA